MTVAEQIEQMQRRDGWHRLAMVILIILAIATPAIAAIAVGSYAKSQGVSEQLDRELQNATVGICNSRATTLRTAPLTVKEVRAVRDALSKDARKVCPGLPYEDLARQQAAEIRKIEAGADPVEVAGGD